MQSALPVLTAQCFSNLSSHGKVVGLEYLDPVLLGRGHVAWRGIFHSQAALHSPLTHPSLRQTEKGLPRIVAVEGLRA